MTDSTLFLSPIAELNLKKKHYVLCQSNVSINDKVQKPLEELSPHYEYKENNFRYAALIGAITFLLLVGITIYTNPEAHTNGILGAIILAWPLIRYYNNNNTMEFTFQHFNDDKKNLIIVTDAKTKPQVESFVDNLVNAINNKELSPHLTLNYLYSYNRITQLEYINLSKKVDEHVSSKSKIILLDPKKHEESCHES
jgi:hypothetical protein